MRWQLDSKTQLPRSCAVSSTLAARGPWPWPKEMDSMRRVSPKESARRITSAAGSIPGESMKISGVTLEESAKDRSMSKTGGSTNRGSSSFETKATTAFLRRSMRIARMKQSRCRRVSLCSHSPGSGRWSASAAEFIFRKAVRWATKKSLKLLKAFNSDSARSSFQRCSPTHSAGILGPPSTRFFVGPNRRNLSSASSISPFALRMLMHKDIEKRVLSFSNKPRQMF
mmetsp:Transcript_133308/g.265971  ORF Transcript_133308/g.265971 Transcript_133308/m.265971 type:complete len:227 (-) Transcript_133308:2182-2862(-)